MAFAGEGAPLGVPLGEGTFEIGLTGTWTVDGDVLTLHPPEITKLLVNGQEAEEFFLLLDDTVDQLAAQQGLSEEEATALKALLALQAPQLIEDVKADLAGGENVSTFSIDGDTLTLTGEEGGASELARLSTSTAVEAHSWGQVKAFWR